MKHDKFNLSKEELRKYNRKKAQQQAYLLLAGVIAVVLLVLGGIGFGIFKLVYKEPVKEPVVAEEKKVIETPESISEEQTENAEETESAGEITPEGSVVEEAEADAAGESETEPEEEQVNIEEIVNSYISNMTLEEKVAGLFIVSPSQLMNTNSVTSAGSAMDEMLGKYPVGGLLLDESNIEESVQLKDLIFNIKASAGNDVFIAIEETGGEESAFVKKGLTEAVISDPVSIRENGDNTDAYKTGIAIGSLLNEYGFNVVIGPVADITYKTSSYTAPKSFGDDKEIVSGLVRNVVHGELDQNIKVCMGFFPGYGDITSNPSGTRPVSSRTAEDIEKNEYSIYKDMIGSGVQMIMVSQIAYKPITVDVPACLSSQIVTDMLRGDLGYDGVIVTDYMNTHSLVQHYKHADAAVMAIEAGCDMIFMPGNFSKAYNGILDAVNSGQIPEERINESLRRIYRVKYEYMAN